MFAIAHLPIGPSSYTEWDVVTWIALVTAFTAAALAGLQRSVRPKVEPKGAVHELPKAALGDELSKAA